MRDRVGIDMVRSITRGMRFLLSIRSMKALEALAWALVVRGLLAILPTERVIQLLDAIPRKQRPEQSVLPPPEDHVRLAGRCLGRSLARSQYLRIRGESHIVVIGIPRDVGSFHAHAWLDAYDDPADFLELRRIAR